MAEYIDIQSVYGLIDDLERNPDVNQFTKTLLQSVRAFLAATPIANVVEVTRCRDCIYCEKIERIEQIDSDHDEYACALHEWEVEENGYCSKAKRGERRSDGGNQRLNKLEEILRRYFNVPSDTYAYNLTRDKEGFAVGTVTLDDFEEFNEETISDLASYIREHLDEKTEEGAKV